MIKIIIGRNGSGKTTYMRNESVKDNSILINAKAATPGESIFSKLTIEELVTTSKSDKYIDNVIEILKFFSMYKLWKSKIGILSGGELKIFHISMMLGMNPSKIYIDEPERDLSEENIKKFIKLVNFLSEKIEFIIVTHSEDVFNIVKNKEVFEMKEYEINLSTKKEWGEYEKGNI